MWENNQEKLQVLDKSIIFLSWNFLESLKVNRLDSII